MFVRLTWYVWLSSYRNWRDSTAFQLVKLLLLLSFEERIRSSWAFDMQRMLFLTTKFIYSFGLNFCSYLPSLVCDDNMSETRIWNLFVFSSMSSEIKKFYFFYKLWILILTIKAFLTTHSIDRRDIFLSHLSDVLQYLIPIFWLKFNIFWKCRLNQTKQILLFFCSGLE